MSHYFKNDPKLKENRREITFRFLSLTYTITSDDGVFSKEGLDKGSEVLLKTILKQELKSPICDLGCGLGVMGLILTHHNPKIIVDGFDVNQKAVELARINYKKYHVKGDITLSDGIIGQYQTVISNPPIRVGKEKLYQLFDNVYASLEAGGSFYFVIRKQHGAKSAQKKCHELFGNCDLIQKDYGFYIYSCRKN